MQTIKQKETVLLYNIKNKPYTAKLKSILLRLGIKIKVVTPEQYGLPIASLLSNSSSKVETTAEATPDTPNFEDEMLVMAGLTDARLNQLLLALRKDQIRIPLKAILTPHNSQWNSVQLRDELSLEHQKMQELNKN